MFKDTTIDRARRKITSRPQLFPKSVLGIAFMASLALSQYRIAMADVPRGSVSIAQVNCGGTLEQGSLLIKRLGMVSGKLERPGVTAVQNANLTQYEFNVDEGLYELYVTTKSDCRTHTYFAALPGKRRHVVLRAIKNVIVLGTGAHHALAGTLPAEGFRVSLDICTKEPCSDLADRSQFVPVQAVVEDKAYYIDQVTDGIAYLHISSTNTAADIYIRIPEIEKRDPLYIRRDITINDFETTKDQSVVNRSRG